MDDNFEYEEFCTCGHSKTEHKSSVRTRSLSWQGKEFCVLCCFDVINSSTQFPNNMNYEHEFNLDNLRLIEQIAKHRELA